SEEELLELARLMTAAQLERAVRAYRRVTSEEAEAVHADAHLDLSWDEDGALVLHGRLAPEDGALLLRALEAARDALAGRGRSARVPRNRGRREGRRSSHWPTRRSLPPRPGAVAIATRSSSTSTPPRSRAATKRAAPASSKTARRSPPRRRDALPATRPWSR